MKTPPYLLGIAILFWGWRTDFLIFAFCMAVIIEGARFLEFRWQFTEKDFNRIADMSAVIVFIIAVVTFFSRGFQETPFAV